MDKHIPDPAFLDRLETRVVAEAHRQLTPAPAGWWAAPRLRLAMAAAIAVVSMGIGAGSVAAAYQVKSNEQRSLLTADVQRRIDLARQRLQIASEELQRAERQVAVGIAAPGTVVDGQQKVAELQVALEALESQLAEVRITGRDAIDDLTAPRVESRDFVGDRLRLSMTAARAALQAEQTHLQEAEKRFSVGVLDDIAVRMAKDRVAEAQSALATLDTRLAIRQRFLAGALDRQQASLQALQADAEQRLAALRPKLQIAQQQLERAEAMAVRGLAGSVDVAQAKLSVEQVQIDLAKADLDLLLVRRQLQTAKGGGS